MDGQLEALRKAFTEELRSELAALAPSMPPLPLPNDVEAERALIGMALRNELCVEQANVRGDEFYVPLYRDIWVSVDAVQRHSMRADSRGSFLARVVMTMEAMEKYSPATVTSEVEWLEGGLPGPHPAVSMMASVREKARCRRICEWMRKIDEDLRLGRIDSGKAIERFGKASK